MILTKGKIQEKRGRGMSFNKDDEFMLNRFRSHSKKWGYLDQNIRLETGQFFLYESVYPSQNGMVFTTYPKIGLYLDAYSADQTIEIEWIDKRRTWEYNVEIEWVSSYDGKTYSNIVADHERSELKTLIFWDDDMFVYGAWDKLPGWKELKPYYEKTWWFYRDQDELRDIQLSRILK